MSRLKERRTDAFAVALALMIASALPSAQRSASKRAEGTSVQPAVGVARTAVQSQDGQPTQTLKRLIVGKITAARLTLHPEGERAINQLVAAAETRYSRDRQAEAQTNAGTYGDAIVEAARQLGTRDVTAAVVNAAASVCPLWPFC